MMPTVSPTPSPPSPPATPQTPPASPSSIPGEGSPPIYRTDRAYATRDDKALYIAEKYAPILRGSVLDVGCDEARLRSLVADPERYLGIDINGPAADITLDLDDAARRGRGLPLDGRSFDTVLCTDVLEHLEHAHATFDELCRVSRERVIVSLPNPVLSLLLGLQSGSRGKMKYYGLPIDPPADRHRWFFNFEEAVAFVTQRGARLGFVPEQIDAENRSGISWRGPDGRELMDNLSIRNGTMWAVLRRAEAA